MDIEEIKCPLCTQIYNEEERIPVLLPDCGHSFCFSCIYECFELLSEDNDKEDFDLNNDEEDLTLGDEGSQLNDCKVSKARQLFKCPEDGVQCSIQNPDQFPKNYALLKIVQKTKESEEDQKKNIVVLSYKEEEKRFIASKKEDNSLARFLTQTQSNSVNNQQDFTPEEPQEQQQEQQQNPDSYLICKQHNRMLELICVDDKQRICTQCALFGQHKGHDVRMEEEVMKEISLKVEVLMEMYQAMEQSCDELNDISNYERQQNIFKKKQLEMKEKIQDKFKEWRKALRAVEMKVIDNLYMNYSQFDDKFQQASKHNNKMINDAQTWMDKAKQQLDEYTVKTQDIPSYIAFDMIDNNNRSLADDILNLGEQLLDRAEKQKGYPSLNGLETQYSQVKLVFEPNLEKKLAPIAKVIGPGQSEFSGDFTTASQSFLPPFSFNEEEDLNEGVNHVNNQLAEGALNLSDISFNEPASPINQSLHINKKEETKESHPQLQQQQQQQQDTTLNISGGNNDQRNQTLGNISKMRRMSTTNASSLQSKKKNDLATIFKTQSINSELDLSCKNLSDMHSNELSKCIKTCSQHIKTLNLSKNRISDEGVLHLIKSLCDSQIEVLNLQGNKISEKCVEGIVGSLKTNKTLKMLDLQNNGIGSRLMKNKLKNALPQIDVLI